MTLCRQSIAPRLKTRPVRIQHYKQVINLLLALRLLVSFALSLEHGSLGMTRLGVISEFTVAVQTLLRSASITSLFKSDHLAERPLIS